MLHCKATKKSKCSRAVKIYLFRNEYSQLGMARTNVPVYNIHDFQANGSVHFQIVKLDLFPFFYSKYPPLASLSADGNLVKVALFRHPVTVLDSAKC